MLVPNAAGLVEHPRPDPRLYPVRKGDEQGGTGGEGARPVGAVPSRCGGRCSVRTPSLRHGNAPSPRHSDSRTASSVVKPAVSFRLDDRAISHPSQPSPCLRTDLGPTGVQAARHRQAIAPPALLCVREVARILAVSTATVYALADRGELAHVRVFNAIRVAPEDLDVFIASKKRSP